MLSKQWTMKDFQSEAEFLSNNPVKDMSTAINDIRKAAGDEVAADFIHDLAQDAERYYRGEQHVQCTCAPPHEYKMREAKCPHYVAQLEAVLREIRETGFMRNTAHKLREKIDAVLPRSA